MPIAINGSGTITGISTGGLPDGCISTDDLANNAVTAGKMGATEQSRLCAAFVNFNGTSTVAIRASYNVSSITDNGTGNYTVNFTNAFADTNYVMAGSGGSGSSGTADTILEEAYGAAYLKTTAAYKIYLLSQSFILADRENIYVAIFR